MKKLILGLVAVAMFSLFNGCLQNLKDNELTVENNTRIADIRFEFRGKAYDISKGQSLTISKIDAGKHGYNFIVSSDSQFSLEKPSFELDYSSHGTKYLVNVFRSLDQKYVQRTTKAKDGIKDTVVTDTVLVSTIKSTATFGFTE